MTSLLGAALVASGQANRIDTEFSKIAARFTEQQADVNFDWSMAHELAGNRQRSEEILVNNLKKFPEHSPSNNGLGYAWADQGRNLDEAQKMIQTALDKDAQKPEYMDSMGWVLYKKGKFEEAVTWLQRARAERNGQHPVILDHLGDALFQSGKHTEAQQVWQMSLQSLSIRKENGLDSDEGIESPELKDLDKKLISKIEAVKNKKSPAVASSLGVAAPAKPGAVPGDD